MDKNKVLIYFAIFLIGLLISYYVIRAHLDVKTIGVLSFFLIFIPTLIYPDIGLLIIIVSMLLSPEAIVGETVHREVTIRIEDIFLLVVILGWFIRTAFTKDITGAFKTRLTAPFFSYIAICVISTILAVISVEEMDIRHSFFSILKYLEYFLLFFMVRDNMKNMRQSKIFIVAFLLTALMVAIYSNIFIERQIATGQTFFRVAPPVETRMGGESGTLGGYLIFMMAIAGGLLLYARSTPVRIFLIGAELLMFRGLLYSLSRGSYFALIPMAIALAYFTKRGKYVLIFILVSAGLLTAVLMPQMVRERIVSTIVVREDIEGRYIEWEESPRGRIESWISVLFERLPESPIFGHGVGKFFIDGQIFLTLCEVGLAGFIVFLWILVRVFKAARDVLNSDLVKSDNFSVGLAIGFLAGFVGLLAQALSTNTFIIIKIMEPFWFTAAIVLSLPQLLSQERVTGKEI